MVSPAHMILQVSCPLGTVLAAGTSIRLFTSVDANMTAEITHAHKRDRAAVWAPVWRAAATSLTSHLTTLQREPDEGVTGQFYLSQKMMAL